MQTLDRQKLMQGNNFPKELDYFLIVYYICILLPEIKI